MAPQYAKDQPAGFINSIKKVAIVGVGGHAGGAIVNGLLEKGRHDITAITRADSNSVVPEGVRKMIVNYSDEDSIVAALKGHDFFIISLAVTVAPGTEAKLIKAAGKAGTPYVMPNWYGGDPDDTSIGVDTGFGLGLPAVVDLIHSLGMKSICLSTGFWYDWSLVGGPNSFGFDLDNRSLTLFDDGDVAISTASYAQVGRAAAALLSLPRLPESAEEVGKGVTTLADFENGSCNVSSFCVSQRDMFESIKRVTGTTDAQWIVTKENSQERFAAGKKRFQEGDRSGFAVLLYTRAFFPGKEASFEAKSSLGKLGLAKEDLDIVTARVIKNRPAQGY